MKKNNLLESKKYFIDKINSTDANHFVSYYHYSHVGFKGAKYNLGIYNKKTNLLCGVLQWGRAAQSKIRLDRYVNEEIHLEEYLELNRFCMADEEERNSESESIALGMKWIKKNLPNIRLLVSYAGRKEGNYGYIYQATNWEYLGYFISNGFWELDGEERHSLTACRRYQKYGDQSLGLYEGLCALYQDVRRIESKQFIYIQRLDRRLTTANEVLPYPKKESEFPIVTNIKIYKQNESFRNYKYEGAKPYYYHTGKTKKNRKSFLYCCYGLNGLLEQQADSIKDFNLIDYAPIGINAAIKEGKVYKSKYFKKYKIGEEVLYDLHIEPICEIEGIPFYSMGQVREHCGVSKQAVHQSRKTNGRKLGNLQVQWSTP